MKFKLFLLSFFITLSTFVFSMTAPRSVDISFNFKQQYRLASNQFAIWIENEEGDFIKNVFVTQFTADSGYIKRREALPLWVKKSNVKNYSQEKIDSICGATPKENGVFTYSWDCTDSNGNPVPDGKYRFFVEGSTYWENRILYSGIIALGERPYAIGPFLEDSTIDAMKSEMITDLKAEIKEN